LGSQSLQLANLKRGHVGKGPWGREKKIYLNNSCLKQAIFKIMTHGHNKLVQLRKNKTQPVVQNRNITRLSNILQGT
jgi:hypothetical protein